MMEEGMLDRNDTALPAAEKVQTSAGLIRLVRYLMAHAEDQTFIELPWDRLCGYVHLFEAGSMLEAHVCPNSQHSHCGIHIAVTRAERWGHAAKCV
jgi:hypothetical protein